MLQFHETVMGKRFFESTMPSLIEEINRLKKSNNELGTALLEQLHKLNENLNPKMERDIVGTNAMAHTLAEGWKPVMVFHDGDEEFIIVERRVD